MLFFRLKSIPLSFLFFLSLPVQVPWEDQSGRLINLLSVAGRVNGHAFRTNVENSPEQNKQEAAGSLFKNLLYIDYLISCDI